jgi:hypothetical protein
MRAQHSVDLEVERAKTKIESDRANAYVQAVLDNHIRAAVGDQLHKGAVEDALLHARMVFNLDAKGNAVKLNPEGIPELGKDGSTPFSPSEWIEQQRDLKPHWFKATTSGSGSTGTGSGSGSGMKTITRAAFDKLSSSEQATIARSGTTIKD